MLTLLQERPRLRSALFGAGAVIAFAVVTQLVLPGSPGGGRGTPAAILFKGLVTGSCLAVFAVSVVLVYRTLRLINFAQGALGGTAGILLYNFLLYTNVPFPIVLVLCLLLPTLCGLVAGFFFLRFFNASRLSVTVLTIIGAGVFLGPLSQLIDRAPFFPRAEDRISDTRKVAEMLPLRGFTFRVGSFPFDFGFGHLLALEIAALVLVGVFVFLRFTKSGIAVRALAENPERAALLGIGVGGLSVLIWTLVGFLDGAAIVAAGVSESQIGSGFSALVPIFAAAVIARFDRIGRAAVAAIAIGIMKEAFVFSVRTDPELFNVLLFAAVLLGLLIQRRQLSRSEASGGVAWSATNEPRPVPKELAGVTSLRVARIVLLALGVATVVVFPFVASTGRIVLVGGIFINAIAVLSLVVLTGWAGQVSLGQFAFVAVGSVVGGSLTSRAGIPFWFALPIGAAVTAALAVVVGLPALRIKGLFLLVSTFSFALAVQSTLFNRRYFGWLLPGDVERPTLFFLDFEDEKSMYFLSVIALVLAIVVVGNLRRSRLGRTLIAVRENEANVQTFGISVVRSKLTAFAVSGALAGFAGVLFAHQQRGVSAELFGAGDSVNAFAQAVVGGVSSPAGALLGSAYFYLSNDLLASNVVARTFITAGGPLLIVFLAPGGLISVVNSARDSILRIVAQRQRIIVPSLFADYDADTLERQLIPLAEPDPLSGLAALPPDDRFQLASELYQGSGTRIVDKLGPAKVAEDTALIGAAARGAAELNAAAEETA